MSAESTINDSLQHKLDFLADAPQVMQAEIARSQVSLYDVILVICYIYILKYNHITVKLNREMIA